MFMLFDGIFICCVFSGVVVCCCKLNYGFVLVRIRGCGYGSCRIGGYVDWRGFW